MEILLEHLGKGFLNMLMIAMPCVLTAAAIGLVVGILQAVTQVQEQTIAAAPKILGVFLMIMIMGGTFTTILKNYFYESANLAFNIIPHQAKFVLQPGESTTTNKGFFDNKAYGKAKEPNTEEIMKNPGKIPYPDKNEKTKLIQSNQMPRTGPDYMERQKITGR